jgi:hypothetical protein
MQVGAHCPKNNRCTWIARIFHPYRVSGIDQQVGGAFERFLHSGDDQNLIGGALNSPRGVQVLGDRLAKRLVPQRLAARKQLRRCLPQPAGHDLGPQSCWKNIECGLIGAERSRDPSAAAGI